jgi:hypothetical protein
MPARLTRPTTTTPTTPSLPTRPVRPGPLPTVKFADPQPHITLPPGLRRPPKATDLIITKGFDGKTPDEAVAAVVSKLASPLAPQNKKLVEDTARAAYRDFNVALNNVFTPGSPNARFVSQFGDRPVSLLGTMGIDGPVYKVEGRGAEPTRFYARDWAGNFREMSKPPMQVVMEARLRLTPPGLVMNYPAWTNKSLASWPLTVIDEP